MQVRFAFVAGVAVVVLLIPINRWLAGRIEAASGSMMACKDVRIKRTAELLRGIRQIKAATWEPSFIARVFFSLSLLLIGKSPPTLLPKFPTISHGENAACYH